MDRKPITLLSLLPVLLLVSDDTRRGPGATPFPAAVASASAAGCGTASSSFPEGTRSAEPSAFRPVAALSFDPGVPAEGVRTAARVGSGSVGESRGRGVRLAPGSGWQVSTDGSGVPIVTDPTAPGSPPFVAQARYPVGFGDGRSPLYVERDVEDEEHSRLYVCLWVKLSESWQGHGSGVNKIGFVWTDGSPVVTMAAVGSGEASLVPQIRLQDLPSDVESARNLQPDVEDATIRRGTWHRWEVLLVMNDWAEANGEVRWWIDGRKVGDHRNLRFVDAAADGVWERVAWRPTWGGRGDAVREPMYMWLDHLYVSGAP